MYKPNYGEIPILKDILETFGFDIECKNTITYEVPLDTLDATYFGFVHSRNTFFHCSIFTNARNDYICETLININIPFIVCIEIPEDESHAAYSGIVDVLVLRSIDGSFKYKNVSNQFDPKNNWERIWDLDEYNIELINIYKVMKSV